MSVHGDDTDSSSSIVEDSPDSSYSHFLIIFSLRLFLKEGNERAKEGCEINFNLNLLSFFYFFFHFHFHSAVCLPFVFYKVSAMDIDSLDSWKVNSNGTLEGQSLIPVDSFLLNFFQWLPRSTRLTFFSMNFL